MDSCGASNHGGVDITGDKIGKRLILPATHMGSDRHMHKLFQDSMTIVRFFGKPDLFITFIVNPNWSEITTGGQTGVNRIDLVARVFNLNPQWDLCNGARVVVVRSGKYTPDLGRTVRRRDRVAPAHQADVGRRRTALLPHAVAVPRPLGVRNQYQ